MSEARPVLPAFLTARLLISAGVQMQVVAVGWEIYSLTKSPVQLGLIGLVQFLAMMCTSFISGAAIDRYPKRLVLMTALVFEVISSLGMAGLAFAETQSVLPYFLLVGVFGAARAFDHPAATAMLPMIVRGEGFPKAVAWDSSARQAAVLCGPSLGGALIAIASWVPLAGCAVAVSLAFIMVFFLPVQGGAARKEPFSWATLMSGISYIAGNKLLLGVMSLDLVSVLFGGATALLPIYAVDILDVGPQGLGLLRNAPAVGGLTMGLMMARVTLPWPRGSIVLVTIAIFGAATIVFGLSQSLPLSLVALAFIGGSDTISMVVRNTMVQLETPDALRGRVAAVYGLVTGTANQLGEFESGIAAALLGTVGSVVFGGVVTIGMAGLWTWRFPILRQRVQPQAVQPS